MAFHGKVLSLRLLDFPVLSAGVSVRQPVVVHGVVALAVETVVAVLAHGVVILERRGMFVGGRVIGVKPGRTESKL